jgi:DNA-binding transcriptional LysR family regulator
MASNANLDLDLLRAFVAVAETGSFTRAAGRLGRVQSAVSMQVKRLEEAAGQRLFDRSRRRVTLSPDGEVLLGYARRMLALNQAALSDLGQAAIEGGLRLGTADTASHFLPRILARFARSYPRVRLEVLCDRSWHLLDALDAGEIDLALVTQQGARGGGRILRREPLVWAAAVGQSVPESEPLPLAVFAPGCAYRAAAIDALDAAGRAWRMAYSSTSLVGVQAAVLTGLAVGLLPQSTLLKGMIVLGEAEGLPPLPDYGITLHTAPGHASPGILPAPAARLAEDMAVQLALPFESVAAVA